MTRRLVTDGRAVTAQTELDPAATLPGSGITLTDVWLSAAGAPLGDPVEGELQIEAPPGGTLFRIIRFPAGGAGEPLWHQTETLDYIVIVEGTATLLTEDGEAEVGPGQTAVVRGLRHAWVNRGAVDCVMACVSVSAR